MTDPGWDALSRELDQWQALGLTARLWLRDDDAVAPTPALERLVALTRRWQAPVLLAVIPALAGPALAERLADEPLFAPCQHGWAHANHASPGEKKSEFGSQRPLAAALDDIALGRGRMTALFGAGALAIFVPPWNRIAASVATALPALGFCALSAFGPPPPEPAIAQLNCGLDLIDWHNTRGGFPAITLNTRLAALLADARARGGAAVGILAHHLAHDAAAWDYLERLLAGTRDHTSVSWQSAARLIENI